MSKSVRGLGPVALALMSSAVEASAAVSGLLDVNQHVAGWMIQDAVSVKLRSVYIAPAWITMRLTESAPLI